MVVDHLAKNGFSFTMTDDCAPLGDRFVCAIRFSLAQLLWYLHRTLDVS